MSKFGPTKYIEIHATTQHETDKAYLMKLQKNGKEVWVPKSQIEPGTRVAEINETGPFSVAEWIAKKNSWLEDAEDEIPF